MADDKELLQQDEIERLLRGAMGATVGGDAPQSIGQSPAAGNAAFAAASPSDGTVGQDEIERLLNQAGAHATVPPISTPTPTASASRAPADDAAIAQSDIEALFNHAQNALASIEEEKPQSMPSGAAPFQWEELSSSSPSTESATLDLIRDVELDVRIELGRTQMFLEDVLKLRRGSVVPLDKLAGDPVDIFVNGRLVARGEVLVLNDNFCVRVAELFAGVSSA